VFYCVTNFPNWCRSFPSPASVACRADSAPQPANLGWPRHCLGLAAHLWGPGVPCGDGVQHPVLAGDCFCCPGAVLDDRLAHTLSIFTTPSIITTLWTFTILRTYMVCIQYIVLFTLTVLSILRSGQFHVYGHQMHLLVAHASCLHAQLQAPSVLCMQVLLCASVPAKCPCTSY